MDFPTDDNINRMFKMAFCLHPDRKIAIEITRDAILKFCSIQRFEQNQEQESEESQSYKYKLSNEGLMYKSLCTVSENLEKKQEKDRKSKEIVNYRPTLDDMLVRYIKILIY
ncbi:MAG: hypothetical protein ETSY1_24890 [Candidatus Entotheonella factor]|uniref:Uncharacterized protein n=1 Tax=Entotheonella factor TaxID=1429438 RepID=W4LG49_ENTF1|nr:MAG: hypothetical protein ETSY1_24890 [Candidatus Entotheonella factor]